MDNINKTTQVSGKSLNKNGQVIQLNSTRVRHMKLRMDLSEKKSILTASIISLVAVVTFMNQKIVSLIDTKKDGRSIASIDLNEQVEYRFEWQKDLAQKLAQTGSRVPASLGETPSKIDSIRFGLLEGKYSIKLDNNTIQEISFLETTSGDRPKYIKMDQFLRENKNLFNTEVTDVVAVKQSTVDSNKEEVYELRNADAKALSQVHAILDSYGRLISMKVTN